MSMTKNYNIIFTFVDLTEFVVSFVTGDYTYEEGDSDAEVCLIGVGEISRMASATISSLDSGSARGRYFTIYIRFSMCRHNVYLFFVTIYAEIWHCYVSIISYGDLLILNMH